MIKKIAVVGDIHLNSTTFPELIEKQFRQTVDTLSTVLPAGSDIIWIGDIVDNWKAVQNVGILNLLFDTFINKLSEYNHFIIKGNHDIFVKENTSVLNFLGYLSNVTMVNEPLEYTKSILLLPHSYGGYKLERVYDYVIAHLGIYGVNINKVIYTGDDLLEWEPEYTPNNIILGHIHRPQTFELKSGSRSTVVDIIGSICPVTWGEIYDEKPTRFIPILEFDTEMMEVTGRKIITLPSFELQKDGVSRQIIDSTSEEIILSEEIEERVELPKHRDKGNSLIEIVTNICKEYGIDKKQVLEYFRDLGLNITE